MRIITFHRTRHYSKCYSSIISFKSHTLPSPVDRGKQAANLLYNWGSDILVAALIICSFPVNYPFPVRDLIHKAEEKEMPFLLNVLCFWFLIVLSVLSLSLPWLFLSRVRCAPALLFLVCTVTVTSTEKVPVSSLLPCKGLDQSAAAASCGKHSSEMQPFLTQNMALELLYV